MSLFSIKTLLQLFTVNTAAFTDSVLFRQANGTIAARSFSDVKEEILSNVPTGNYIPLTGTGEGSPVTGNIFVQHESGSKGVYFLETTTPAYNAVLSTELGLQLIGEDDDASAQIDVFPATGVRISADTNSKGLFGNQDFSENYDEFTYVQKLYVDKANSYSTDETVTGGMWLGKPIYRKVLQFTIIGSSLPIDVSSLNREVFIRKTVNILSPDGKYISDCTIFNGSPGELVLVNCSEATDVDEIYVNSYTLNLSTGATTAFTPDSTGYLILDYTKTTD